MPTVLLLAAAVVALSEAAAHESQAPPRSWREVFEAIAVVARMEMATLHRDPPLRQRLTRDPDDDYLVLAPRNDPRAALLG